MQLKWPEMQTIQPEEMYRTPGQRLYWPAYHLSLVVPPACAARAGQVYCQITSDAPGLVGHLELHDADDRLVSGWLAEAFNEGGDLVQPVEAKQTRQGVESIRFASATKAGYKVRVDDPFRNGISGRFIGPAARRRELSRLVRRVVGSVRFVHLDSLTAEQIKPAILAYANCDASSGRDLFLYLDRHFYLMRNDVMGTFERLTNQAEKERDPGAPRLTPRWQVLQQARKVADDGAWDATIADLRKTRP